MTRLGLRTAAVAVALHAAAAHAQFECEGPPAESKYLHELGTGVHTWRVDGFCRADSPNMMTALVVGRSTPIQACEAMGAEPADSPRRGALVSACLVALDQTDRDLAAVLARYLTVDRAPYHVVTGAWAPRIAVRTCEEARDALGRLPELVAQPSQTARAIAMIEALGQYRDASRCPGLDGLARDLGALATEALENARESVFQQEALRVALEETAALAQTDVRKAGARSAPRPAVDALRRIALCIAGVRAWSDGRAWPSSRCRPTEPSRQQLVSEETAAWLHSISSSPGCSSSPLLSRPVRVAEAAHRLVCAVGAPLWRWSQRASCPVDVLPVERDPFELCDYARWRARFRCQQGDELPSVVVPEALCREAPVGERLSLALDLAGMAANRHDAVTILAALEPDVTSSRASEQLEYWEAITRIAVGEGRDAEAYEAAVDLARRWHDAAQASGDTVVAARAETVWASVEAELGQTASALRRAQHAAAVLVRHRGHAAAARARYVEANAHASEGRLDDAERALASARASLARADELDLLGRWSRCGPPEARAARERGAIQAEQRAWELEADRLHAQATGSWDLALRRAFAAVHEVDDQCEQDCRILVAATRTVLAASDAGFGDGEEFVDHLRTDLEARTGDPRGLVWELRSELHARLGAMAAERGQLARALDHFHAAFGATAKLLDSYEGMSPRRMARLLDQLARHEGLLFSSLRRHARDARVRRLALAVAYQRQGRIDGLGRRSCHGSDPAAAWRDERLVQWLAEPDQQALCGGPDGDGSLRACLEHAGLDVLAHFIEYADPTAGGARSFVAVTIDRDGQIRWLDLGDASRIDTLAHRLLEAASRPTGHPERAAYALTQRVFRPALGRRNRARVAAVLDGSLRAVPVLLLADDEGEWLDRIAIVALPSARALAGQPRGYPFARSVLFADPAPRDAPRSSSRRRSLPRAAEWWALPGTRAEVRRVAALLERADVRIGQAATETELYQLARNARILHLATHGSSAPAPSEASAFPIERHGFLQLAPSRTRAARRYWPDGRVTAEEIAENLDLRGTELAVLSACESGRGPPAPGRGYGELRHAFLAAGASTVVSSLWTVDDEATRDLMARYYVELSRGVDRHDALARAAAAVRRRHPHPHYWAAFQVLGAPGRVCMHGWSDACR